MGQTIDNIIKESIHKVVNEGLKRSEVTRIIKQLYKAVDKTKLTAHVYNDIGRGKVEELAEFIISTAQNLGIPGTYYGQWDVEKFARDDVRYRLHDICLTDEDENALIKCTITAHAAGSMEDPWDRYDMTAQFTHAADEEF